MKIVNSPAGAGTRKPRHLEPVEPLNDRAPGKSSPRLPSGGLFTWRLVKLFAITGRLINSEVELFTPKRTGWVVT